MAIRITRVYREHFPALRLIGQRYTNDDRGEDGFAHQWNEWRREDRFDRLMQATGVAPVDPDTLGLMTCLLYTALARSQLARQRQSGGHVGTAGNAAEQAFLPG